jgi:Domain of unknown function (DUF397)
LAPLSRGWEPVEDLKDVAALALTWDTLRSEALPRPVSLALFGRAGEVMDSNHDLTWRKASYSGSNGGGGVEVAGTPDWQAFLCQVKHGWLGPV